MTWWLMKEEERFLNNLLPELWRDWSELDLWEGEAGDCFENQQEGPATLNSHPS